MENLPQVAGKLSALTYELTEGLGKEREGERG